jgi:hypothetical protein
MGIRANIEIFECAQYRMSYTSIDDALSHIRHRFSKMKMNRELKPQEEKKLRKFLETNLTQASDGTFSFTKKDYSRHALIWWDKKLNH